MARGTIGAGEGTWRPLCFHRPCAGGDGAIVMNQQANRLALLLLVLNVLMLLVGVFDLAWEAHRAAARPPVPTDLAAVVSRGHSG
jgi:hypothetical protein